MKQFMIALSLVGFFSPPCLAFADDASKCQVKVMVDYSKAKLEAADKALNEQYKKTRETLEKNWDPDYSNMPEQSAVEVLLKAQRSWIA